MPGEVRLTSLDWALLSRMRERAAAVGYDPQVLPALAGIATPHFDDADHRALAAARADGAPPGAVFGLQIRSDPVTHAPEVANWLKQHAPNLLDDVLVELSFAGPTTQLSIDRDLLLAYYSPAYRWMLLGMVDEPIDPVARYDGPKSLLDAVGGRLLPDASVVELLSGQRTRDLAAELGSEPEAPDAIGEMRHLYDFCDDFVAANYPLDRLCHESFETIRRVFQGAADRGLGMRIVS